MSSFTKFLNVTQSNPSNQSAAQDFLDEKMSKNKYMSVSNPENPYSMGEGSAPSAPVYKPDSAPEKPKTDSSELSGGQKTIKFKSALSDLGFDDARIEQIRNHAQGASGSGAFGYTSDTEHHFRETANGTSAGSIEADMRKIGNHLGYKHWGTANPKRIKEFIMAQEKVPEAAPQPEEEIKPIEHSPEIKQAKERVQSYEQDVLSGKTSEDIYGIDYDYSFDAAKGAAGIGTPMNGGSSEQASKATASFLDNKKLQVKDKYQFQAQG